MPLLLLLPFAGSITLFLISFLIGFLAVRTINKMNKTSKTNEIAFLIENTGKYVPVPVKDKLRLTESEQTAWEQIVNNSNQK